MTRKVGFLAVNKKNNKAFPLWLSTDSCVNGAGSHIFYKANLGRDPFVLKSQPFLIANKKASSIFESFQINNRKICFCFDCHDSSDFIDNDQISITPESALAALKLAEYVKDLDDTDDDSIIISADIEDDILWSPKKLGVYGENNTLDHTFELKLKCFLDYKDKYLGNSSNILLLAPADFRGLYDLCLNNEKYKEINKYFARKTDTETKTDFNNAIAAGKLIFCLPQARAEKQSWLETLRELFGFEKFESSKDKISRLEKEELIREEVRNSFDNPKLSRGSCNLFSKACLTEENASRILNSDYSKYDFEIDDENICNDIFKEDSVIASKSFLKESQQFNSAPNLIITGPTGCGKTLLAKCIMINALALNQKVLYIGPTRALVDEELGDSLKSILNKDNVRTIVSTGEKSDDDWRFYTKNLEFDLACIVNEKANLLMSKKLWQVGLIVIDELHMLSNPQRSGPLDMLIAKIKYIQKFAKQQSPRIVVISTESILSQHNEFDNGTSWENGYDAYLIRTINKSGENKKTEIINFPTRPTEVKHEAIFLFNGKFSNIAEATCDIRSFKKQEDRQLQKNTLDQLKAKLTEKSQNIRKKYIKNTEVKVPYEENKNRRYAELIEEKSKNFSKYIVVGNDKKKLQDLANELKIIRADKYDGTKILVEVDDAIKKIIDDGYLSPKYGNFLKSLALYGIFLHHADLPKSLRVIVEEFFHKKKSVKNSFTPIVFCTETLSYGVNLTADGLMLLDIFFKRDNFGASLEVQKPLTSCEYHNILGRIGRFKNLVDSAPTASIIIECKEAEKTIEELCNYYNVNYTLKSEALLKDDIERFLESDKTPQAVNIIESINFQSFRTIIDTLRTISELLVAESVSLQDMFDLFQETYYFFSHPGEEKIIKEFFSYVLDSAAECKNSENNMFLVKKEAKSFSMTNGAHKYVIGQQAEALVDTGSNYKVIEEGMGDWVLKFIDLETEYKDKIYIPIELIIPSLLTSDIFSAFSRALKDFDIPLSTDEIKKWDEKICLDLKESVKKFTQSNDPNIQDDVSVSFLSKLLEFSQNLSTKNVFKCNLEHRSKINQLLLFTACQIVFLWIQGKHEMIGSLLRISYVRENAPFTKIVPDIPSHFMEKLSWLAQMESRFFYVPRFFRKRRVIELQQLVVRLRKGVSSLYYPFAIIGLSPSEINSFLTNGITPAHVLKGNFEGSFFNNIPVKHGLIEDLSNYYEKEANKLDAFINADSRKFKYYVCKLFEELKKDSLNPSVLLDEYKEILDVNNGENTRIASTENGTEYTLFDKNKKTFKVILTSDEKQALDCDAICIIPWDDSVPDHKNIDNKIIITPMALYTLVNFVKKDFPLDFNQINSSHGILDLSNIISLMSDLSDIGNLSSIFEPGY